MIPTYVLSLEDRKDRREAFSLPWDYTYLLQNRITHPSPQKNKIGHWGAILAHKQAVEIAHKENYSQVLVVEDDAEYLGGSIPDFGFVTMLAGFPNSRENVHFNPEKNCFSSRGYGWHGAHAVVYNKKSYPAILDSITDRRQVEESRPLLPCYGIDFWLGIQMGVDIPFEPVFRTKDMGSDISAERGNLMLQKKHDQFFASAQPLLRPITTKNN